MKSQLSNPDSVGWWGLRAICTNDHLLSLKSWISMKIKMLVTAWWYKLIDPTSQIHYLSQMRWGQATKIHRVHLSSSWKFWSTLRMEWSKSSPWQSCTYTPQSLLCQCHNFTASQLISAVHIKPTKVPEIQVLNLKNSEISEWSRKPFSTP